MKTFKLTWVKSIILLILYFFQINAFSQGYDDSVLVAPDKEEEDDAYINSHSPIEKRTYYSGFFFLQTKYGKTVDALWDKTIQVSFYSNGFIGINGELYKRCLSTGAIYVEAGSGKHSYTRLQFPHYPQKDEINLITYADYGETQYIENYGKEYRRLPKTPNFNPYNENSDLGTSNSSSSPSRSERRASCSKCGGTGVDPNYLKYWGGRQSWLGHYNSSGSRCSYCGKYDEHYHSRCSDCNVPSY